MKNSSLAAAGLIAVLCLQFGAAIHQFEHGIDEATEYCTVCVVQDRHDDVVADLYVPIKTPSGQGVATLGNLSHSQFLGLYSYRSRAPPVFS